MNLSCLRSLTSNAQRTNTLYSIKTRIGQTLGHTHSLNSNRKLWTAATSSHPDLATALSHCLPSSIFTESTSQPQVKDSVTVVFASRSYLGSDLLSLPSKIPSYISKSSIILGAVVDRVPTESGHGVSTLTLKPTPSIKQSSEPGQLISCKPFYLSGSEYRRKRLKEKSVGKWARPQDIEERSLDTADAWSSFKTISVGHNQVQVPEAVLPSKSPSTTQDILLVSDLEVHQFLEALDNASPKASKVGLLASSTPFITGLPVTMFYDGKILQDGILGVSIIRESNKSNNTSTGEENMSSIEYPTLAPLGPAMQITRCRGNIILELDESNATKLLLDQLKSVKLTKEKEYFLATGEVEGSSQSSSANVDMSKATVYKITGGDPSKGNMAVDTVHDLNVGQWVQFIHHDKPLHHGHYDSPNSIEDKQGLLRFSVTDPNCTIEEQPGQVSQDSEESTKNGLFGGSSENGFIVGQPDEHTWVCSVADSVVRRKIEGPIQPLLK
ncbi:hypothetical protein BGZ76_005071 [Entomortierella beljakovae]|nr:hypothetical protein BGZ76_005071 [Entomortierella beljakovae]